MKKLSPSVKLRKEVSEFIERLQDVDSAEDVLTQLVQLSTQLITQEGLEAHQRDHLGVDRYERGEGRRGYRSGYEPGYLDTAEGRLEVAIPQVRGSDESYRCTLYDVLRGDSEMVQRLATEMYARGLSTPGHRGRFHRRAGSLPAQSQQGQRGDRGSLGTIRGFPEP